MFNAINQKVKNEMISDIARQFISQEFPEELPYFDIATNEFFLRSPQERNLSHFEEELGFGGEPLSTIILLAIIGKVVEGIVAPIVEIVMRKYVLKDDQLQEAQKELVRAKNEIETSVHDSCKKFKFKKCKKFQNFISYKLINNVEIINHLIIRFREPQT